MSPKGEDPSQILTGEPIPDETQNQDDCGSNDDNEPPIPNPAQPKKQKDQGSFNPVYFVLGFVLVAGVIITFIIKIRSSKDDDTLAVMDRDLEDGAKKTQKDVKDFKIDDEDTDSSSSN